MASSAVPDVPDYVTGGGEARRMPVFATLGAIALMLLPGCHKKKAHAAPAASSSATAASIPKPAKSAAAPAPSRPGMLLVAAGTFTMGDDDGSKAERPAHRVTISKAFLIDETEVTVDAYRKCVNAGKCSAPSVHRPDISAAEVAKFASMCNWTQPDRGSHPVNCVDRDQAADYCEFVGKRLPTEAEWEYAARGKDARKYPWGNEKPGCDHAVVAGCKRAPAGKAGTEPVASYPAGKAASGAFDMAGNVWEWVADGYDPTAYKSTATKDPMVPARGGYGVLRGGSWDFAPDRSRATARLKFAANAGHVSTGFRCAAAGVARKRSARLSKPAVPKSDGHRIVRFRCPGGAKPTVLRTGCTCPGDNEIHNPCKIGGLGERLEGNACVFDCPPPILPKGNDCLTKCNNETGWRYMGQCQMKCNGTVP